VFGYAGKYTDPESDLIYLRARYYDPASQQFLTRDPLAAFSETPYSYAGGNPVNATDPTGELPILAVVAIGLAASVAFDVGVDYVGDPARFDLATSVAGSLQNPLNWAGGVPVVGQVSKVGKSAKIIRAVHRMNVTTRRHTIHGSEVLRDLRRGKEAHVFNEGVDLADLERRVWTHGTYRGEIRGWERLTYRSDTPIGRRIQSGKPDIPLYEVEIKGRLLDDVGEWEYHLVPRPRPAQP
jgi:RHS repeat-associated protein